MAFSEHHFLNFSSKLVISVNNVDRETKLGSTVYRVMKETTKITVTEKDRKIPHCLNFKQ